jgi:hypothetical protein
MREVHILDMLLNFAMRSRIGEARPKARLPLWSGRLFRAIPDQVAYTDSHLRSCLNLRMNMLH